jgi:hypothetical protein
MKLFNINYYPPPDGPDSDPRNLSLEEALRLAPDPATPETRRLAAILRLAKDPSPTCLEALTRTLDIFQIKGSHPQKGSTVSALGLAILRQGSSPWQPLWETYLHYLKERWVRAERKERWEICFEKVATWAVTRQRNEPHRLLWQIVLGTPWQRPKTQSILYRCAAPHLLREGTPEAIAALDAACRRLPELTRLTIHSARSWTTLRRNDAAYGCFLSRFGKTLERICKESPDGEVGWAIGALAARRSARAPQLAVHLAAHGNPSCDEGCIEAWERCATPIPVEAFPLLQQMLARNPDLVRPISRIAWKERHRTEALPLLMVVTLYPTCMPEVSAKALPWVLSGGTVDESEELAAAAALKQARAVARAEAKAMAEAAIGGNLEVALGRKYAALLI